MNKPVYYIPIAIPVNHNCYKILQLYWLSVANFLALISTSIGQCMRPGVRVMSKQMDSTLVCPSRSVNIILVMSSSQIYNLTRDTRFFSLRFGGDRR